ncbi:MAG: caspase family protein [Bacteroidota bacterium]
MKVILLFVTKFSLFIALCFQPIFAQNGRLLMEIGRQLGQTGADLIRTIEYYTDALEDDPDNGAYHASRATAYFDGGQYREAIDDYDQAISYFETRNSPRLAKLYYQRGLCHYILSDYRAAEEDFTRAIARRPDVSDAFYFRGKLYAMIFDQTDRARRDFRIVLSKSHYPAVQSAFSRYFMGENEAAERELKAMLARVPKYDRRNYAVLRYNAAGFYALRGEPRIAVDYLRQALQNGYDEHAWLVRDMNFRNLQSNSDFISLLDQYGLTYLPGKPAEPCFCPEDGQEVSKPPVATRGPSQPASVYTTDLTFSDENGNQRIDADESTKLDFVVHNAGPGLARDLEVVLSESGNLPGLRFERRIPVGSLAANAERKVSVEIQGDRYLQEGLANFKLEVREQYGFDAIPAEISIATGSFAPPDMVIADHIFASEKGGPMNLGVPITLRMAIQNQGRGVAEGVLVKVKLPENVYPGGQDEFDLGQMAPGADQVINYEFFTNRRYQRDRVPIVVEVQEASGKYNYKETLEVAINEQLEMNDRVVISPTSTPVATNPREIRLLSDVDRNLPRTNRRNPTAVAVVIGNRDYENSDVPTVDHALQDAASMRKYLIESFGFDENNIIFMANATQADFNGTFGTKEDHRARLFNLVRANESDVFVFYSGHGAPDLASEDAYFLPADCDPSLVRFNGYAINTMYDNLSKIPYRSLTVVIDACFSGQSDRGTLTPQASIVRIRSNNSVLKDPKAMIFTAATGAQVASWYPEQSHGLFTYYFLKGLQGAANTNRDRTLTLEEMKNYLDQEVPYQARRLRNRDQNPEVFGIPNKTLLSY